jgi:hypothetical protein
VIQTNERLRDMAQGVALDLYHRKVDILLGVRRDVVVIVSERATRVFLLGTLEAAAQFAT